MYSKKPPPNEGGGSVPSDGQAREKLVLYVYEYLLHMGAKSAANSFLQEIHWDKSVTLGDPPGFLHSWWCIFWDLYCAAPERRDSCVYSTEAKAFHDYGFVNSGYAANGLHGPSTAPSPLGMAPQGPADGMPPGPAGMGPPHPGFFASPVPGPHMRPSPPQQGASQPSPHVMMNQPAFMNAGRYPGPNPRPRLGQEPPPPPPFVGGPPGQPMFAEQIRPGAPPHLMPPQRMPPAGSHHPMRPMGPNGFSGMRPNMGPVMGPGGMPPGPQHLQRSWSVTNPPMGVSNGPTPGGPGTPIMPSPQSLPDGSGPDRFGMMQPGAVGSTMAPFSINSEPSGVGGVGEMMMNGDGLDIKHSPASIHGGLNGGTPGPGGPNSVPPSSSGESCGLDYGSSSMHPFQASSANFRGDQEAEIQKIKDSICEESKRFESGKDSESGDTNFYLQ